MKKFAFIVIISGFFVLCCNAEQHSPYKNDEKHIAKEVDINNVPVDPACKFQTVWSDVRLSGITRSEIPNSTLKYITVIKFNYAGAWIAWSDDKGYHEPSKESYVPWKNFPSAIKEYYEQFYLPDWKGLRSKTAFPLRTAQIDPRARKYQKKRGNYIERRAASGVLCRALFNNVFIPYSELPLDIRTKCGFYENESYIPEMPVLEKQISTLKDDILFVPANGFRIVRRYREGVHARVMLTFDGTGRYTDIFVQKIKGRINPNHSSDLHFFKDTKDHKVCTKCGLSDHLTEKFFNFMFDRQIRNACPVAHREYAFIKKGTQRVGRITMNSYQYLPDYDQKFPKDSKRLLGNKKIPVRQPDAGAPKGNSAEDVPGQGGEEAME